MPHRTEDVRNVALVGAAGAGKTSLVEASLFLGKMIPRKGTVEDGTTVADYDPDERSRKHSLTSKALHLPWEGAHIQLIDTPGAPDFSAETASAVAAVETVAIAVSAHDRVSVTARRRFEEAGALGLVRIVVATKVDQENTDPAVFEASLQANFGEHVIPMNVPDAFGPGLTKIHNVFADDVPAALRDRVLDLRKQVIEAVVECDDALIDKYFREGAISKEELWHAFPKAIREGHIVPVLHTSSRKELGARQWLDFLAHETPSPAEGVVRAAVGLDGASVKVAVDGPFAAQVWKIVVDPHVGKVAHLRIHAGSLAAKTSFVVRRTEKTERIGDLYEVQGKDLKAVPSARAGDLVAVTKVEDLRVGDTVTDGRVALTFAPIAFPRPVVSLAVLPKSHADDAKLLPELHRLAEADPSFVPERDASTGELVVRGTSPLHLETALHRLAHRKVEVTTHPPKIAYRETVGALGSGEYRHKKQSGGRGQFAEVHMRVEPLARGSGFEFVDAVVGGTIPRQFIPAVEKGVRDALGKGELAGFPVTDVRATVHFGKFHEVDSDEHSFKLAGGHAFHVACSAARPLLLEPLIDVEIDVPSRFLGDVSGDLNSRRGRILGVETSGDHTKLRARVPMAEMTTYATELRSLTAGEGEFRAELSAYDRVPPPIDQQVIAKHKKAAAGIPA